MEVEAYKLKYFLHVRTGILSSYRNELQKSQAVLSVARKNVTRIIILN